jgi:predicted alpha/beta-fold hydrolase
MTAIDAKTSTAQSFRARSPWIGGDLQTLRNFLTGKPADLSAWPGRPLTLGMKDGSGDALAAKLHGEPGPDRPLLVLIHGLTGCEDSKHVRTAAAHALSQGYAVLRLNLRGAAPQASAGALSRRAQRRSRGRAEGAQRAGSLGLRRRTFPDRLFSRR